MSSMTEGAATTYVQYRANAKASTLTLFFNQPLEQALRQTTFLGEVTRDYGRQLLVIPDEGKVLALQKC